MPCHCDVLGPLMTRVCLLVRRVLNVVSVHSCVCTGRGSRGGRGRGRGRGRGGRGGPGRSRGGPPRW